MPAESRKKAAVAVWDARRAVLLAPSQAAAALAAALEADPDNLAALVDRAQMLMGSEEGAALARRAVELYPTHPEAVHWYAHSIWKESWRDGARLIEAALPTREQDPDLLYDLACASSLSDDVEGAERYLRRSIVAGFDNFEHIATDADLRNLRGTAGFRRLMQEYRR